MRERVSVRANISRPILMEKRGGERNFFNALFSLTFFGERDFTCIRTVVGPQQSHKGMLLKYAGEGWGGQKISYSVMGMGGEGDCFPCIPCILEGWGQFLGGSNQF